MINLFNGEYEFLSNFYFGKNKIFFEGLYYPTAEHAFQAAKTIIPGEMDLIRNCKTPGQAKRMASKKTGKITLRPNWDSIKDSIMLIIVINKFKDPILEEKLISTYPKQLTEGNYWHDNYWGDCNCEICSCREGLNKLGNILMNVRDNKLNIGGLFL